MKSGSRADARIKKKNTKKRNRQTQSLTSQAYVEFHILSQTSKFTYSLRFEDRILCLDLHGKLFVHKSPTFRSTDKTQKRQEAKEDVARQALNWIKENPSPPYFWDDVEAEERITDYMAELAEKVFVHKPSMEEVTGLIDYLQEKVTSKFKASLKSKDASSFNKLDSMDSGRAEHAIDISPLFNTAMDALDSSSGAPITE